MCWKCRGTAEYHNKKIVIIVNKETKRLRQVQSKRKYWKLIWLDKNIKGPYVADTVWIKNSGKFVNRKVKKWNPPRYQAGEEVGWYTSA